MDKGQIVKCGSHPELLHRNGLYRQLWDLQNQIMVEVESVDLCVKSAALHLDQHELSSSALMIDIRK